MIANTPPLDEERQKLAADAVGFALYMAIPFIRERPHLEQDLRSAALYGLTRAAGQFQTGRRSFIGFAKPGIRWCLRDVFTSDDRRRRGLPGAESVELAISRERPPGADLEDREEVEAILAGLNAERAASLRRRFLDPAELPR